MPYYPYITVTGMDQETNRSNMQIVIFLLVVLISVESVRLPSNFKKCNRKQEDLKKCVLEAVQNAVPQLTREYNEVNIPNVNPFYLKEVTVRQGARAVAVDQYFKNCNFFGFNKFKVDMFEFNFEKKTLEVKGLFPALDLRCEYRVDGKVLLLPVKGEGNGTVVLNDVLVTGLFHYEETKRKNNTYIKMVSSEIHVNPALVSFNFENLFNGDKVLGDNINKVLNDNWKEVFEDVKSDYIEIIKAILLSLLNNFFSKVSIEEAFD